MSVKSRMIHIALRYRHFLKGHIKREVIDQNTSIEQLRRNCDKTAEKMVRAISGVSFVPADYDKCYAEWVVPDNAKETAVILYFHGGGFVMGNAKSHRNIVSNFVRFLGYKALVFDYSLAPEFPAPAAVNDSVSVYSWMLECGNKPERIIFAGDSSGGGIELAAMLKIKDDKLPLPAACVAFSPCTDMTMSGESHKTRAKSDPCTSKGMNETYLGYYVGKGNPLHPYASPIFGDLSNLPPIMIHVGNDETLRDDSIAFAEKAKLAGVEIYLKVWKGMFHCFPLLAPMFKEATKAMDEVAAFINAQLLLDMKQQATVQSKR